MRLLFATILTATLACACDCISLPPKAAIKGADVVFRGTITAFRDSDDGYALAVFDAKRVWKGPVGPVFTMPAFQGDACFDFRDAGDRIGTGRSLLKIGNDLLVYAYQKGGEGHSPEYFPQPCKTVLFNDAGDIRSLGRGKKPGKPR